VLCIGHNDVIVTKKNVHTSFFQCAAATSVTVAQLERKVFMKTVFIMLLTSGALLFAQTEPAAAPPSQAANPPAQAGQPATAGSKVANTLHVYAYPAKGQSQDIQSNDENSCYQWAQSQGAGQPAAQPASSEQSQSKQGGAGKGAAKGAAGGAAIGAIAGDAGTGAGVGAVAGAAGGRRQRKKAESQQEKEQQSQQTAAQQQQQDQLKRAYSACMEAKGYTVK